MPRARPATRSTPCWPRPTRNRRCTPVTWRRRAASATRSNWRACSTDVHGQAVAQGCAKARNPGSPASTATAQNVHGMLPVKDPHSPVFVDNQVQTCGQCHEKDLESYLISVHGHGLQKSGLLGTAVCSSCHGAHGIYKTRRTAARTSGRAARHPRRRHLRQVPPADRRAAGEERARRRQRSGRDARARPTRAAQIGAQAELHRLPPGARSAAAGLAAVPPATVHTAAATATQNLSDRYGLSLHGALTEIGYGPAANCADCHGAHDILPLTDPALPGVGRKPFGDLPQVPPVGRGQPGPGFDPHADHRDRARLPVLHWVYVVLMTFLIGTFAVFGMHSILWFVRELINVLRHGRPRTFVPGHVAYVRFSAAPPAGPCPAADLVPGTGGDRVALEVQPHAVGPEAGLPAGRVRLDQRLAPHLRHGQRGLPGGLRGALDPPADHPPRRRRVAAERGLRSRLARAERGGTSRTSSGWSAGSSAWAPSPASSGGRTGRRWTSGAPRPTA